MNKWPSKFRRPVWRKPKDERLRLLKEAKKRFDAKKSEATIANKLLEMVSQGKAENVDLIKTLLDRLWRQSMNGGTLNGKDFAAIDVAQKFLRRIVPSS